jgi:hypothetical protein
MQRTMEEEIGAGKCCLTNDFLQLPKHLDNPSICHANKQF